MTRKTVTPAEMGTGFYMAFGSDLGMVGFFRVRAHPEGLVVWGLSRWRGVVGYRTLGIPLAMWAAQQPRGVQYRPDRDRTDWPMDGTP